MSRVALVKHTYSRMTEIRTGIVHFCNGLKGLGVSSCRRLGSGFFVETPLPWNTTIYLHCNP